MKGKITKLRPWKSGEGCFVGIDGGEKDYLCNGNPDVKVGDEVVYEVGKPTKDGKPTLASIHADTIEAFIDKPDNRAMMDAIAKTDIDGTKPYRAHDWKDEVDTRRVKVRLECLKLAIEAGATDPVDVARKYEQYARE